jgi:hypothetical protein
VCWTNAIERNSDAPGIGLGHQFDSLLVIPITVRENFDDKSNIYGVPDKVSGEWLH